MQTSLQRRLGNSSVSVSAVTLGAWAIGGWLWGGTDEAQAIDAIRASIDNGVNTIDTAAIYGQGYSEEIVGRAIAGYPRDRVVIATKCGRRWDGEEGSNPWQTTDRDGRPITVRSNSRPASIIAECEQSLRRLGVETIDLYQIHWPDPSTPVEDAMEAMHQLVRQGKIRAIGVSNYSVAWLDAARRCAPVASVQPPYSLIQRHIESELLPYCRHSGVGVVVYSPMERGLLTGKITADYRFGEGDHRAGHAFFSQDNRRRVSEALESLRPIADAHDASFAQLVIAWTIHQPGITAALVGARNAEQATHNARAMQIGLSDAEQAAIRAAFDSLAAALAPASQPRNVALNTRSSRMTDHYWAHFERADPCAPYYARAWINALTKVFDWTPERAEGFVKHWDRYLRTGDGLFYHEAAMYYVAEAVLPADVKNLLGSKRVPRAIGGLQKAIEGGDMKLEFRESVDWAAARHRATTFLAELRGRNDL